MDKRNTWNKRYYKAIVLLLLTTFSTFGQCDKDSVSIIQVDSTCQKVQMSPEKFTEFYLYKKNLEKIKRDLPDVQKKLDSLNKINDLIEENLQAEIDSTNKQKFVLIKSLDDCTKTLVKIDIENDYLTNKVGKLKKRQWKMFGYGTAIGSVSVFLIKILIQ